MRQRQWKQPLALGASFALSGCFLWLAFRQVDRQSLVVAFSSIGFMPVLFCVVALSLGIFLRSLRWRVVAGFASVAQRSFSRATNLGALTNLIFPGRAGEFVRVITLARLLRVSLPGPLASALIDRLIDVFVLLASASALYWLLPIGDMLGKWLASFFVVGCLALAAVVVYAKSTGVGEKVIARLGNRWLSRWPLQPAVFLAELRSEFVRILESWLSAELFVLAALILCVDYCAIGALVWAFDLALPWEAPLVLWVCLAAGSALPSAPGYVGVYQVAAVWALALFAVPASTAVAIATTLQICTLAVAVLMVGPGAVGVFKHTLSAKSAV